MTEAQSQFQLTPAEHQLLAELGLDAKLASYNVKRLTAKAGEVLYNPGDTSAAFLVLLNGSIRVELITKSNREIVLYRVQKSQTCLLTTTALLKSEVYFARGVAESDITALAIPAKNFHTALSTSPKFTQYILSDYAHRVESLVKLIDRITSKDIKSGIANILLSECGTDNIAKLTQLEIARNIGTAREVVTRKLANLEKQGLIKRERGRILILDKTALAALAS